MTTRLRIKTETETLHDEQVSDEHLADRKQAFALQVEIYNMQGIECKLVEGENEILSGDAEEPGG